MSILTTGRASLSKEKFNNIYHGEFYDLHKPDGGLWGSTFKDIKKDIYASSWLEYCAGIVEETFFRKQFNFGVVYELKDSAKILNIDSDEDYINLHKNYGDINTNYTRHTSFINWIKLSKDYDAIHFTEECFLRWRNIFYRSDLGLRDLFSFDCESWIIFNFDCIDLDSCKTLYFAELTNNHEVLTEIIRINQSIIRKD